MTDIAVWHRADLRPTDNAALAAAAHDGHPAPLFCFDSQFYGTDGLACDARLRFLHESLTDLRERYRAIGSDLALVHADPRERIPALLADGYEVYVNADVTARYGRDRDADLLSRDGVSAFGEDGIVRNAADPRDGWDDQCEAYFEADPHPVPESLSANPLDSEVTIEDVERRYDVVPEKRDVPTGGRTEAERRLGEFVDRIRAYPRVVSPPAAAERNGSRLSAYLKFGCLSTREVYRRVQRAPECRGRELFVSRLYWNRHYHQKLQDWAGWADRAVNPVFHGLYRSEHDSELLAAWKEGRTGFPMVDASMRALVETGFLNFRMRAMCASFLTYVLREPWTLGADFFYYHLVDAAMGINHTQWQSQAGVVGVHSVRVYDPAKQGREYDPDGEFVREYVPELAALPDEHLPRPEKAPLAVLEEAGVELGADYPYPVVDYERRAAAARERFARLDDRATEAIRTDRAVWRRASLSTERRERLRDDEADAGGETGSGQASLDEF
ncbi:deoxyribodipyrimidine photo-lyase/cryptochrome family protein [Salinirubellus salinus]|uniref:Deoxyribodipyrimidine photo-lyase/cryptochrome family protein n=1 Tax=Salinirubellus salinus TaxID=1364945 RepID=A0A9E7R6G8_9EURY|nr:deoxyribodipyrimidine photo-lyase/cryptochrome family protein [Salinirubellus salinus]UWM55583.1 deoxyribodipyrimidine photo-lyase/cryptochrome family protein [Salinirubellus salinus]